MYAFVSVGQCGGGLLDSVFEDRTVRETSRALAINSATSDLLNLKNVKKEEWLGLSRNGFLKWNGAEFEGTIVGGYGQDRDKAERDSAKNYGRLLELLSEHFLDNSVETKKISCAFVMFGLGGGTGSGAAPIVASAFRALGIPVIAIAVLPAGEEGSLAASNAYVSLKRLSSFANSVILVDNQRIAYTGNMAHAYARYNDYVAKAFVELILGSASERINPANFAGNPPVIDINDIITATTLKGRVSYACMARSSEKARDLVHYLFPVGGWKRIDVIKLLYESFLKITLEGAKPGDCEKNLALLRLPPYYLEKEGELAPIDIIRSFLSENSVMKQTHLGVSITRRNIVSTVLLFTYEEEKIDRILQLKSQAAHYKQEKPNPLSLPRMVLTKVEVAGKTNVLGAEVEIDGRRLPAGSIFSLAEGRHDLKVTSKSHEAHAGTIHAEKHSVVSVNLGEKEGGETVLGVSVTVEGKPVADAEVIVDDKSKRTGADGKLSFSVGRGTHKLTVIRPGYRIAEMELDCTKESEECFVELKEGKEKKRKR